MAKNIDIINNNQLSKHSKEIIDKLLVNNSITNESLLNTLCLTSSICDGTIDVFEKDNIIEVTSLPFLISFIIPTYNRSDLLKECLESIFKQTYSNYEIIIINDNSTDNTEEYIYQLTTEYNNIKYFRNKKNLLPGFCRHLGLVQSKGDYIIFCDDDDFYIDSQFLARSVKQLEMHKTGNTGFISSNSFTYFQKQKEIDYSEFTENVSREEYLEFFQYRYKKPNSTFTTLFDRNNLIKSGVFEMKMVNDASIYLRSLLYGDPIFIPNVVGIYRITDRNISNNIKSGFLIENLKEKKYIRDKIKTEIKSINHNEWWKNQLWLTLVYFIKGTNPSFFEFLRVFIWVIFNNDKNISIIKGSIEVWLKMKFYSLMNKK